MHPLTQVLLPDDGCFHVKKNNINRMKSLSRPFGHRVRKSRRGPSCKKASVLLVVAYVSKESKATQRAGSSLAFLNLL